MSPRMVSIHLPSELHSNALPVSYAGINISQDGLEPPTFGLQKSDALPAELCEKEKVYAMGITLHIPAPTQLRLSTKRHH